MHLAQLNVARFVAPVDSAELADFVAGLEPINTLADTTPGFVWRFKGGEDPTDVTEHVYGEDILINFSVWESRETLWNFVYRSAHLGYLQRRREWFSRVAVPYSVMWWIPVGHTPEHEEGMARLELLRAEGPNPQAFTFKDFYDPVGM